MGYHDWRNIEVASGQTGFVVEDKYKAWIEKIKDRIKQSQIKASVKEDYNLLDLYWDIGREIFLKQKNAKWGELFLETVSWDLQKAFPNMSDFSVQNLKSIRYWYEFYNSNENGLKPESQMELIEKIVKSIPWGHNQRIICKCKNIEEALFYAQNTIENGWSRAVLEHQIDSGLYGQPGKALTNFQQKLPEPQSDLSEQTVNNPCNLDFLALSEKCEEKELEHAISSQTTQFLLELGTDCSYFDRQVHLHVDERDFYIDLLFYHARLQRYVVVELKTEKFRPEFTGKLNLYVAAVNKQMKTEQDNPTIGILICKDKNEVVTE